MPKLPIFRFLDSEPLACPSLTSFTPSVKLDDLQLGVDNLRYDVHFSARVVEDLRLHLSRYICRFGEVANLLEMDVPSAARSPFLEPVAGGAAKVRKSGHVELKPLLISVQLAILNRAKAEENPSIDLLGRFALLKFIRTELNVQFARILELCRAKSKSLEGLRQAKMMETRELVASFQIHKKIILRKSGQEIFRLLREIEKETISRTRRSLLGELPAANYRLFLNPLLFNEDGRDDYLCAENYYMFGNFDKDPDRFANLRRLVIEFLQALGSGDCADDKLADAILNVPENAVALVGTGAGDDSTPENRDCSNRLEAWVRVLQKEGVMPYVIASYEAVALLPEYAPRINPQQLKNALISRDECERVEKMIQEGRLSPDRLRAAVDRVSSYRAADRNRVAARLLRDLFCYHRDLRSLEALNAGFDSTNLIGNDKVRELSVVNGMLYEFLAPEDQKTAEDKVVHHVILKADIRDSSRLTRSLMDKGMNAASYFSLNFYDPINKLVKKHDAVKVFLEGDAIIVALLERESESMLAVSRACVLAWEILDIMRGYNRVLDDSRLPQMEVGLGIAYQDSPPLYLMDGDRQIMISDAINLSDRLSSCAKRVRKKLSQEAGIFQVYSFQMAENDGDNATEDVNINYNVGGIRLSEVAFHKLEQEISLAPWKTNFKGMWLDKDTEFFFGTVPLGHGLFRKIAIRKSRIAELDVRDFSILRWTDRHYFEVCANPAVYAALPSDKSATAGQ